MYLEIRDQEHACQQVFAKLSMKGTAQHLAGLSGDPPTWLRHFFAVGILNAFLNLRTSSLVSSIKWGISTLQGGLWRFNESKGVYVYVTRSHTYLYV